MPPQLLLQLVNQLGRSEHQGRAVLDVRFLSVDVVAHRAVMAPEEGADLVRHVQETLQAVQFFVKNSAGRRRARFQSLYSFN